MQIEPLIATFRGPLIGFFAAKGMPPGTARELAHDVFVEAYLGRARFRGDWDDPASAGAWLRGIATNLFRAARRRAIGGPVSIADDPADDAAGPAERAELRERRQRVRDAIDGLRSPWRTVLYMHYLEGSSLAAIGGLLDLGERAVEGRLRRARAELERVLVSEGAVTRKETGE